MAALAEVALRRPSGLLLHCLLLSPVCPRYAGSSSEETVPAERPTAASHTPRTAQ